MLLSYMASAEEPFRSLVDAAAQAHQGLPFSYLRLGAGITSPLTHSFRAGISQDDADEPSLTYCQYSGDGRFLLGAFVDAYSMQVLWGLTLR